MNRDFRESLLEEYPLFLKTIKKEIDFKSLTRKELSLTVPNKIIRTLLGESRGYLGVGKTTLLQFIGKRNELDKLNFHQIELKEVIKENNVYAVTDTGASWSKATSIAEMRKCRINWNKFSARDGSRCIKNLRKLLKKIERYKKIFVTEKDF